MKQTMIKLEKKERKKREPNCALCQSHGIKVLLKGHKRHCKFRYCECPKCLEIKERQEYMADMQYIKRNGVAEEARLGKRADMIAIYNERMKNKSKKKVTEPDGSGKEARSTPLNGKSITLESVDSIVQDLITYIRDVLKITDEDDILFHCLVVLIQDLDGITDKSQLLNILSPSLT
ncbi:doublesex- and mab-3-related transcription factor C2 isoform X4 [Tetranychus urticae]|nr:doublesex- and mab-3-related transcription factor C2 isoform X2 [Tetranychus urticae]XP_015788590.1 doublesex- and mab-3-related transcription factor C2 isoform X4 [Tetranychus urticae]